MDFVFTVSDDYPSLDSQYLTTLQGSVKYYKGKSTFTFDELKWSMKKKPSLDCVLSTYDIKHGKCIATQSISQAVESVVTIPNIGLLIKISPLLTLIDDFSYFVYHMPIYDKGFTFVTNLSWNWTNGKWVPPQFLADALHLSTESTPAQKIILSTAGSTPTRFSHKG